MGSRSPAELLGTVPVAGDANLSEGEWLLVFSPGIGLGHHWRGPYKVINARRRTGARGFIVIAEVLGGIEPGEKGYLRTGKPQETQSTARGRSTRRGSRSPSCNSASSRWAEGSCAASSAASQRRARSTARGAYT